MTRAQLLQLLIGQARASGFEFKRWYHEHSGMPWTGADEAVRWLARGKRAHMLVFSHTFARAFFRSGERITFVVPQQTFQSARSTGEARTVQRKAHLRQSSRSDVWEYHLREMATAPEPLRYLRRYLLTEETMSDQPATLTSAEEDYDEELMVRDAD
ncbi:hypothetical protein Terro_2479 [Terriglobus roseus DSM 18391]|uniref:Uncharacterized protein n=1 Tax=Terriglobus roseus (strain DSM 18391 / NRRL B-41598 / KBS 63) TaxID=926566 RepID=I3ZGL9_TERRK|nr:hypothetical protein [Terriglobus roseus]AFL88387.1 hypothetical protein Terro_2115 [Terriglobus roseus DSM 18391]AFL88727.1 hypothetical protein Terro_2479 [Terriglobus roseus DSM 18391]